MHSHRLNTAIFISSNALILPPEQGDEMVRYHQGILGAIARFSPGHVYLITDNQVNTPAFPFRHGADIQGQPLITKMLDQLQRAAPNAQLTALSPYDLPMQASLHLWDTVNPYTQFTLMPLERYPDLQSPSEIMSALVSRRETQLNAMPADQAQALVSALQMRIAASCPYGRAALTEQELRQAATTKMPTDGEIAFHAAQHAHQAGCKQFILIGPQPKPDQLRAGEPLTFYQAVTSIAETYPQAHAAALSVSASDSKQVINTKLNTAYAGVARAIYRHQSNFFKPLIPIALIITFASINFALNQISEVTFGIIAGASALYLLSTLGMSLYQMIALSQTNRQTFALTDGQTLSALSPLPQKHLMDPTPAACCLPNAQQWREEQLSAWLAKGNPLGKPPRHPNRQRRHSSPDLSKEIRALPFPQRACRSRTFPRELSRQHDEGSSSYSLGVRTA